MTDAELAAVVAAALAAAERSDAAVEPAARRTGWNLPGRLDAVDAASARRIASARSRWSMYGRPRA